MVGKGKNQKSAIRLLVAPNLRSSILKVIQYFLLKGGLYDTLLLNFPEEMENRIKEFVLKNLAYEEVLEYILERRIIPDPVSSWEYTAKPVIEALPKIVRKFPDLNIYCYGSSNYESSAMEISHTFARLTLRTILTERVDLRTWRETIIKSLRLDVEEIIEYSKKILSKAGKTSACLTDTGPSYFRNKLYKAGLRVRVHYFESPYHFTPLSILERRMSLGPLRDDELEQLVLCHIEYVRNYVYRFRSRDRAHYEWSLDKGSWPKILLSKDEIKYLDNLIMEN